MQREVSYFTSYTFSLMLSSHLRLCIPNVFFFSGSTTKILQSFLIGPTRATCRAHLKLIYLIIITVSGVQYTSLSFFPFLYPNTPFSILFSKTTPTRPGLFQLTTATRGWSSFLIKPTRRTNFHILFCQKTLHVSGISSAHHREFSTVYSTLVYFLQVLLQLPSRVRMELFHLDPFWKLSSDLHEIYQCRMYSRKLLMMGRGNARNM